MQGLRARHYFFGAEKKPPVKGAEAFHLEWFHWEPSDQTGTQNSASLSYFNWSPT
jgi:hypothetical protein